MTAFKPNKNRQRSDKIEQSADIAEVIGINDDHSIVYQVPPNGSPDVAVIPVPVHGCVTLPEVGDLILVAYTKSGIAYVDGLVYSIQDQIPDTRNFRLGIQNGQYIDITEQKIDINMNDDTSVELSKDLININFDSNTHIELSDSTIDIHLDDDTHIDITDSKITLQINATTRLEVYDGHIDMIANVMNVPSRTSDPSPLQEGDMWFRSDLNELRYYNGTNTIEFSGSVVP